MVPSLVQHESLTRLNKHSQKPSRLSVLRKHGLSAQSCVAEIVHHSGAE